LLLRSSGRYHESSLVGYAMTSLQVFYEGRVQGVGFRWTVRRIAKGFDVIGWVRNLLDGRVEMQVSGQETIPATHRNCSGYVFAISFCQSWL